MDRHASGDLAWLDDVLRQAGIDPARLARVESMRRPVVERNNPWHDQEGIEESTVVLDAARGAQGQPGKLLFVTDVDEDPIARVQAAVQLARAAVARGLDVLLVDADIRHVGLTRWLPDRDLDAEGLVDVLQYGASVVAARRSSHLDGIDVLGVGSYRPDFSGIFGADDVRRLHAQLRSSASLVILVAPARVGDGNFHPLLRGVDAVAISMHADAALAGELAGLLEHLSNRQLPLAGMFVWAGPGDADRFVDDALLERSRALPPANPASPFPGRRAEPESPTDEPADPATAPIAAAAAEPAPSGAAAEPEEAGPASVRMYTERGRSRHAREQSRAPRVVLGLVAITIVAFVGWWALTYRSVEPTRPRVTPPERRPVVAAEPAPPAAGTPTTKVAAEGEAPAEAAVESAKEAGGGQAGEAVETSRDLDGLLAAPVESGPAPAAVEPEPEPESRPEPVADALEVALRRGGNGWALHPFSFPDSLEAVADARRLEAQGYSTAIRGAMVKGQRWYRVLVGDFPDRASASRYREAAQEKFHADWVGVVKK